MSEADWVSAQTGGFYGIPVPQPPGLGRISPGAAPAHPLAGRAIESSATGSGVQNGILSGIPETRELSCRLPPAATPDKECRACASVSETVRGHPPSPCHSGQPGFTWGVLLPRATNSGEVGLEGLGSPSLHSG